ADSTDITFLFQSLQMIGNSIRRRDLKLTADFRNRRGIAFLPNRLEQEIIDIFLPGSQRSRHKDYILKIISGVKTMWFKGFWSRVLSYKRDIISKSAVSTMCLICMLGCSISST